MTVAAFAGSSGCGPSDATDATYRVVFELTSTPEDLGALRFEVEYRVGELVGLGTNADCELLEDDDGETAIFDDDDDGTVEITIDATENPIPDDTEIVACNFVASTQPTASNFTVTILDAEDEDGNDVEVQDVDVVVRSTEIVPGALGGSAE